MGNNIWYYTDNTNIKGNRKQIVFKYVGKFEDAEKMFISEFEKNFTRYTTTICGEDLDVGEYV